MTNKATIVFSLMLQRKMSTRSNETAVYRAVGKAHPSSYLRPLNITLSVVTIF